MANEPRHLDHVLVTDHVVDEEFLRGGRGGARIRSVSRDDHGAAMIRQFREAVEAGDNARDTLPPDIAEMRDRGTVLVLEGAQATFPLKVDSLESRTRHTKRPKRPKWLLLSVHPAEGELPERATVWVADAYRAEFLQLFQDYLTKVSSKAAPENWTTPEGNPKNQALVANIARIRRAVLHDLWTSEGEPPTTGVHWWEIWLDETSAEIETFERFAGALQLRTIPRAMTLRDRRVVWVEASWFQLETMPFTRVPVAEVRRPGFVDSLADLKVLEQAEYISDLASRVVHADTDTAPAVCHLDTGIFRAHVLIQGSLSPSDVHTVIGTSGHDIEGHGTSMAGLALYGDLTPLLTSSTTVHLQHRLESVRMKPHPGEPQFDPLDFGTATASAVAAPESVVPQRARVFCLPLTTAPDKPGEPTLWSATIDALAVGSDVARDGNRIQLLSAPAPEAARLIVVAAGNVDFYARAHLDQSDTSPIEDPAQAWNALTVSASTNLDATPTDPAYAGWSPLAERGELSPHSRTSLLFTRSTWPIKPDICMEGGNVLSDGGSSYEDKHPVVSLRSLGTASDLATAASNATSAAAAQAARLAALSMARYPSHWPETTRGLLTHAAEWTPPMKTAVHGARARSERLRLLRRYGWGVPSEDGVLNSSRQAVTLVTQDTFVPFEGKEFRMRHFRLHTLPWPAEALEAIGDEDVRLRVTLSYFIEPSASRRGWHNRYAYASHGLRFDLQGPLEAQSDFVRRVNREAQADEAGLSSDRGSTSERWLVGSSQRHTGSLHQDEWVGTGQQLSQCSSVAVYPVGGWWKNNARADRASVPVRYALLVSLRTATQDIDLYTPIASEVRLPTAVVIG